jgi:lipopolysaccharide biosynthesis glycosyltransferase
LPNVALAADENFVMPLAVAVRSIIEQSRSPSSLDFAILDCGITERSQDRLRSSWSLKGPAHARFIEVDRDQVDNLLPPSRDWISGTTYARLLLPQLVPEWSRVLYIDADTVTMRDIDELWSTDLRDTPLAAAQDFGIPYVGCVRGVRNWGFQPMNPTALYFNAGVMVLDLDRIRAARMFEQALAYVRSTPDAQWFDQEALNAVVNGRFTVLDQSWNALYYWLRSSLVDHEDLLLAQTGIRHFAGPAKPWYPPDGERVPPWGTRTYFEVLDRTAWAGWRPEETGTAP